MYAIRKDTLAGIRQSALFEPRLINPALKATVAKLNAYMKDREHAVPETEALKFYFSNHVYSVIAAKFSPHEPLPPEVASLARGYVKLSSELVVRLAYYVLMITTREARHAYNNEGVLKEIKSVCGEAVANFLANNCGTNENGAVNNLRNYPPEVSLLDYVTGLVLIFNKGSWGHSYGGPKWGMIADTLRKLIAGEISAEMFADTAFTLAHNGGPMFNKGMLYHTWEPYLYRILDVQRSGQIPQMIAQEASAKAYVTNDREFASYVQQASVVFPAELTGYVDWFKVEALGSLKKYPAEKKAQIALFGDSPYSLGIGEKEKKLAGAKKYFVGPGEEQFAYIVGRAA